MSQTIQCKIDSCLPDSKTLLVHLQQSGHQWLELYNNARELNTHVQLCMLTADIENYFPAIRKEKLFTAINAIVPQHFNANCAFVVIQSIELLMKSKHVVIGEQIFFKLDSLSIGEYIATGCASIYRFFYLDTCVEQIALKYNVLMLYFKGYIDDLFSVLLGAYNDIGNFKDEISKVDDSIRLPDINLSTSSVDYLDLTIMCDGSAFTTKTFRKPTFVPQYICPWSYHRDSHKQGIFTTESTRFLINDSCSADFDRDVKLLSHHLPARGYPLQRVNFDLEKRAAFFTKFANRSHHTSFVEKVVVATRTLCLWATTIHFSRD